MAALRAARWRTSDLVERSDILVDYLREAITEGLLEVTTSEALIRVRSEKVLSGDCLCNEHRVIACSFVHNRYGPPIEEHVCDVVLHVRSLHSLFASCLTLNVSASSRMDYRWRTEAKWCDMNYDEAVPKAVHVIVEAMAHAVAAGAKILAIETYGAR